MSALFVHGDFVVACNVVLQRNLQRQRPLRGVAAPRGACVRSQERTRRPSATWVLSFLLAVGGQSVQKSCIPLGRGCYSGPLWNISPTDGQLTDHNPSGDFLDLVDGGAACKQLQQCRTVFGCTCRGPGSGSAFWGVARLRGGHQSSRRAARGIHKPEAHSGNLKWRIQTKLAALGRRRSLLKKFEDRYSLKSEGAVRTTSRQADSSESGFQVQGARRESQTKLQASDRPENRLRASAAARRDTEDHSVDPGVSGAAAPAGENEGHNSSASGQDGPAGQAGSAEAALRRLARAGLCNSTELDGRVRALMVSMKKGGKTPAVRAAVALFEAHLTRPKSRARQVRSKSAVLTRLLLNQQAAARAARGGAAGGVATDTDVDGAEQLSGSAGNLSRSLRVMGGRAEEQALQDSVAAAGLKQKNERDATAPEAEVAILLNNQAAQSIAPAATDPAHISPFGGRKVFVGGTKELDSEEVEQHMTKAFGPVASTGVVRSSRRDDEEEGQKRGFGFVTFFDKRDADRAVRARVSMYKKGSSFARIQVKACTEATRDLLEIDKETSEALQKWDSERRDKAASRRFEGMTPQEQRSAEARAEKTKEVAIDCEMVGTGAFGKDSILARVSIVNSKGQVLYSRFVIPSEPVTDFRTKITGITAAQLTAKSGAVTFQQAQSQVGAILKGRILIGHALRNDFAVLKLKHPLRHVRDTARFKPLRDPNHLGVPSLKSLADRILSRKIQGGVHDPTEDARTAMRIYQKYAAGWEREAAEANKAFDKRFAKSLRK